MVLLINPNRKEITLLDGPSDILLLKRINIPLRRGVLALDLLHCDVVAKLNHEVQLLEGVVGVHVGEVVAHVSHHVLFVTLHLYQLVEVVEEGSGFVLDVVIM